jgi:hypothetical protein|tara:strand:+ start:2990 stop:3562 length:573 start_codon:yes stop_codon:yes gene_type:complete
MDTNEITHWLRSNVDWNRFCTLVNNIGTELNERKLRFDKSDLFEKSLEKFSNGLMRYVNQEGVDHILPDGTTVEMKYTQDSLFTTKTQKQKEYVADLQLMNSRGGSEGRTLPETYAQYLLICDNNAIAVAPTEMLEPYLENAGDGIKTKKLPISVIQYVATPKEIKINSVNAPSYKEAKYQMQQDFLNNF